MRKLVFAFLVITSACKYNDMPTTDCGVKDPANDLPWLKAEIQTLEQSSIGIYFRIEKVVYNGETGFYIRNCCPMCDTMPVFFRCSGEMIKNIDPSKLTRKAIIWQPPNYACVN